ncbi:MAG: SIS domain-containing protein [Candidatus Neomarinimicrobiota bacterium]
MYEKNPVAGYLEKAAAETAGLEWETAARIVDILAEAILGGSRILVCGNGGSAADSSHFAGELAGRFRMERRGFPVVSLSSDSAVITAIANDYGFEKVFERQVEALGSPGDVLIALSTSGTSSNIVRAAEKASEKGMTVIGFTSSLCTEALWADVHWRAVSAETSHAQEQMIITLHGICHGLEVLLADKT